MLSQVTLTFLNELCTKSHEAHPEGGTLWTYEESANQAHSKVDALRRKFVVGPMDTNQLGAWLQAAQGDRGVLRPESVKRATELLCQMQVDLDVDEFLWEFEDAGCDMTANIHMARTLDNRYFALKLWWSED